MSTNTAIATGRNTWKLDPAHTQVEFAVKHMMITTVKGRFTDVEGTIVTDEEDPTASSVEVTIDAASIDTRVEDRDNHLRSADFLDVENHPELTFRSTEVEQVGDNEYRMKGDLTIRGVTRPVELHVEEEGRGRDPWGGTRAGFTATTEISRKEWGLTWNQTLETGGVLVADKVRISISAQAVLED